LEFGHASDTALPCGLSVSLKEPSPSPLTTPPRTPLRRPTTPLPQHQTLSPSSSAVQKRQRNYAGAFPGTSSNKATLRDKSASSEATEEEDELGNGECLHLVLCIRSSQLLQKKGKQLCINTKVHARLRRVRGVISARKVRAHIFSFYKMCSAFLAPQRKGTPESEHSEEGNREDVEGGDHEEGVCFLLVDDNALSFYIGQEKNDAREGEHEVHNGPEGSGEGDKGECMHSSCL
jgi:hypothetical protein